MHGRAGRTRLGRVLIVIIVGVGALMAAAFIAARFYVTSGRVTARLEALLSRQLAGTVAIGMTDLRWPLRVVAGDVRVFAPDGSLVLVVRHIAADVAPLRLLLQEIAIVSLEAEGVGVLLAPLAHAGSDPPLGLLVAFEPTATEDPTGGTPSRWGLQLSDAHIDDLRVRARFDREELRFGPATLTLHGVTYRPTGASTLAVEGATLRQNASEITVTGAVKLGETTTGTMAHVSAHLDLDDLATTGLDVAALGPGALAGAVAVEADLAIEDDAEGPRLSVEVRGEDLLVGSPVDRVACALALVDGVVRTEGCTIEVDGGALHALGGIDLRRNREQTAVVTLDALPLREIAAAWLGPRVLLPHTVTGTIEWRGGPPTPADGSWRDVLGAADIDLTVSGMPREIARWLPPTARLRGAIGLARSLRQTPVALALESGSLRARVHGILPLEIDAPLELTVDVRHRSPAALFAALDLHGRAERLRLKSIVTGSFGSPSARGLLTIDRLRISDIPPLDLQIPYHLSRDTLDVRRAVATLPRGGWLSVSGSVRMPRHSRAAGVRLRARADLELELGELGLRDWTGHITGSAEARGRLDRPTGTARLDLGDLRIAGRPLGAGTIRLASQGSTLAVRSHFDGLAAGTVDIEGAYEFTTHTLRAEAAGRALSLELVGSVLDSVPAMTGSVRFAARAQGPAHNPRMSAHAASDRVMLGGATIGAVEVSLEGTPARLGGELEMSGPAGTLTAVGSLAIATGAIVLDLEGHDLRLSPWAGVLGVEGYDATGRLALHVEGELPFPTQIDGWLSATDVVAGGEPLGEAIEIVVHGAHDERSSYLAAIELGGDAAATVLVRPSPTLSVEAKARLESFEVHRWLPALRDLGATAVVTGVAEGRYGADRSFAGELALSATEVGFADQSLRTVGPVRVAYDGVTAHLGRIHVKGDNGIDFEVYGSAGTKALDLRLGGVVDLALVPMLVPAFAQAGGQVRVTAVASGPTAAPRIEGQLEFASPLTLRLRSFAPEIRLDRGQLVAATQSSQRTTLRGKVQGTLDGGAFAIEGSAVFAGLAPHRYDLRLTGLNLPVRQEGLLLEANADLRLTGGPRRALLGGRIDVVRGRYLKKFELRDFNFVARETQPSRPLGAGPSWLAALELDVSATSEGGFELRIDAGVAAMDLQLLSDVHVGGTALSATLEGRIEASHGRLEFPKAQLEVTEAVVEFARRADGVIAPEIELHAEGEVSPPSTPGGSSAPSYLVELDLSGDLRQMALELSSTPELNRLEVLALLVRGEANLALASGTNAGDSSTLDAALAFAGSQLTQPLSDFVEDQLERTLNLDVQLGAELTSSGLRVTASQQVMPRLYLQGVYERSLATSLASTSARARVLLTDRLFLEGSTRSETGVTTDLGSEGSQSRLELKWRLFGP